MEKVRLWHGQPSDREWLRNRADTVGLLCSDERGTGLLERITSDHRSLLQLQLYDVSDRDSGMLLHSVAYFCLSFSPVAFADR